MIVHFVGQIGFLVCFSYMSIAYRRIEIRRKISKIKQKIESIVCAGAAAGAPMTMMEKKPKLPRRTHADDTDKSDASESKRTEFKTNETKAKAKALEVFLANAIFECTRVQ